MDTSNRDSRSDLDEQEKSVNNGAGHSVSGIQDKYERIKNCFKMLIEEAPYLIDDKTFEKCEEKPVKEQFSL